MINQLRLRNFKCFKDQVLELRPLTMLSGLNGMGKSSVIQSLLLLRQSYEQNLLPDKGLALNGDLVGLGTAKDALFEGANEDQIGFTLNWSNGKEADWLFNYNQEADVLELISAQVIAEIYNTPLFNDKFHYLQAERIGPRTSFEISDYIVRQHHQLGTRGEYTAQFLSIFGRNITINDKRTHPESNSPKLEDQVEAWVREVSPGTRLKIEQFSGIDLMSLRYSFVTGEYVSDAYRPTNVGFGLTYTLPILVALLSAEAGSLVLLENPEAHLHPKGQAKIGELIALAASCGVQVLLETHSDHVLNGIRLAVHAGKLEANDVQLHYFQRQEQDGQAQSEIISPRMDANGRIDQWPDGFFDEWDKSLDALLEPRNI
ncbi:MAG: DUF3696 domain-containing protein [Chloroflexota bacterium]|nr:DUF3696 domain-containing protein [Chloroflexota bacterium]